MIHCFSCGKRGREVIENRMYRCDSCETTWSPVSRPVQPQADRFRWPNPVKRDYDLVPYVDHAAENAPCP